MTVMQRWGYALGMGPFQDDSGEFILASDAEAAIRDAYERGYDEATVASIKYGEIRYAGGQRDMLARCIEAVYALVTIRGYDLDDYSAAEAMVALRGLQEGGQ